MDNYIIDRASLEHLPIISELNQKLILDEKQYDDNTSLSWTYGPDGQAILTDRINKRLVFIAWQKYPELVPVGYISGSISEWQTLYKKRVATLENIFVEKAHRGNDIGTMLIQAFELAAKEQNAQSIRINCLFTNPACDFYQKKGFTKHAIQFIKNF